MAETAERVLRLLTLLQRRPSWAGEELAERLGVGTRTVRRDAERLRQLGYPVDTSPGPGGGYRLGVGTDMPPLLLDDEEAMAVAVVLGVSAGAAVPGIERAALATLSRIDRLLPPRLRTQLTALRANTFALMSRPEIVAPDSLVKLARACDGHQRVRFRYRTRQGEESERRAEPHGLVATDRRWYLVAHDLDRDAWRTFRVDRMSEVQVTGHTFTPRRMDDPAGFVAESISIAPYLYQAVVRVMAPQRQIAERVAPDIGLMERLGPDETRLQVGADDLEWIAGYLVGLGFDFEVEEPPELRRYMEQLGRRLYASHRPAVRRR